MKNITEEILQGFEERNGSVWNDDILLYISDDVHYEEIVEEAHAVVAAYDKEGRKYYVTFQLNEVYREAYECWDDGLTDEELEELEDRDEDIRLAVDIIESREMRFFFKDYIEYTEENLLSVCPASELE